MALLGINWPYLRSGQTIGMRLVGTKVVMANGEPVTFVTAVLRLIVLYDVGMDCMGY
ncbi:RDD family protein [Photobacterium damselae]|uniref:RDD family protein n=1 Tax=Photobacterium damselae TaxID=38293 RepID=UPI0015E64CA6